MRDTIGTEATNRTLRTQSGKAGGLSSAYDEHKQKHQAQQCACYLQPPARIEQLLVTLCVPQQVVWIRTGIRPASKSRSAKVHSEQQRTDNATRRQSC